jgi:hypothetical protein
MSEKGSAKPHANPIDFTSRTSCQYAGREGLLFWTKPAVGKNYTYHVTVGELKSAEICGSHMPSLKVKSLGNLRKKKYF